MTGFLESFRVEERRRKIKAAREKWDGNRSHLRDEHTEPALDRADRRRCGDDPIDDFEIHPKDM